MPEALGTVARPGQKSPQRGLTLPHLWASVAIFLPVVTALEASISTIDLAYQVRAGDIMLRTHRLIRVDTFTFTAFGRSWLDQQWGGQLIFALLYRAGGWATLALFRAALVGAIFLFVFMACRSVGAGMRTAAWLTLASFLVSVEGLALRPQLIGMALFAATLWLVFGRRGHPERLWLIPPLVVVWANIHGSFFLAPILLGLAWLEDLRDRNPIALRTFWVGVASAVVANLNPFGVKVWSYALGISTNPQITRFINEWQPPTVREFAGAMFFLSAAVVVAVLLIVARPVPWPSLLSLGVFFAIGLFAVRGIFWWGMLAPVVLAQELSNPSVSRDADRSVPSILNLLIAGILVVLAVLFLPWWRPTNPVSGHGLLTDAPAGLTVALRAHVEPGDRVFNAQRWGSWLEFATPRNPVVVDSRIEVFPAKVWSDYEKVSIGQEGWQRMLDRWHVKAVVANRGQQGQLIPRIRRDAGWRLVYQDARGLLFVRS